MNDDDELCGACNGTGEGRVDCSVCRVCHGRGIAPDYESEYEARCAKADYENDEEKLK